MEEKLAPNSVAVALKYAIKNVSDWSYHPFTDNYRLKFNFLFDHSSKSRSTPPLPPLNSIFNVVKCGQKNNNNMPRCVTSENKQSAGVQQSATVNHEWSLEHILCVRLRVRPETLSPDTTEKNGRNRPQKSKETSVILERNVTFLCSWLSPVFQSASYQEVPHNGSKLPETQSQTFGTEVGADRGNCVRRCFHTITSATDSATQMSEDERVGYCEEGSLFRSNSSAFVTDTLLRKRTDLCTELLVR